MVQRDQDTGWGKARILSILPDVDYVREFHEQDEQEQECAKRREIVGHGALLSTGSSVPVNGVLVPTPAHGPTPSANPEM